MEILNVFNALTLIQIFWKTKTFFKKLEYRFLVETTKIENTSFPFKTALSFKTALKLLPNFQKGGAWQVLNFERRVTGKEGVTFFGVGCNFTKKKNKSEIFNDKKSL